MINSSSKGLNLVNKVPEINSELAIDNVKSYELGDIKGGNAFAAKGPISLSPTPSSEEPLIGGDPSSWSPTTYSEEELIGGDIFSFSPWPITKEDDSKSDIDEEDDEESDGDDDESQDEISDDDALSLSDTDSDSLASDEVDDDDFDISIFETAGDFLDSAFDVIDDVQSGNVQGAVENICDDVQDSFFDANSAYDFERSDGSNVVGYGDYDDNDGGIIEYGDGIIDFIGALGKVDWFC